MSETNFLPFDAAAIDIILWLVDVSEAPGGLDRDIAAELKRLPPETKIVLVLNKSDLPDPITVPNKAEPYKKPGSRCQLDRHFGPDGAEL